MKNNRTLNGYIVVYKPEHTKAMNSKNWKGYVYEHIIIAEEDYGRQIKDNEVVHHLDMDRSNNSPNNLIILDKKSHNKIHKWINRGAPLPKGSERIPVNSEKPKLRCGICNKPLKLKQRFHCSKHCMLLGKKSKMDGVSLDNLLLELSNSPMYSVAKKYRITDNGLKKWLFKKHGFNKATLSEALSTLRERAETSGEVKSS